MASLNRSEDDNLLVALRHPLRRDILRQLADEKTLTPREMSEILDKPLSNVSYHVRVLADCAAVVLVRTEPVGGSLRHFYRQAVEAPWARQILGLPYESGESGGESSPPQGT